ncbi:hypothetical protein BH10CYA1_BH10CYA1_21230 [soil metagenome]
MRRRLRAHVDTVITRSITTFDIESKDRLEPCHHLLSSIAYKSILADEITKDLTLSRF